MRSIKFIFPVVAAVIITFTFCRKKETVEVDNEVAEQEFMAMVPAANSVAIKTRGTGADKNRSSLLAGPCDSLHYVSGDTTFTNLSNPPTFTMNFNTSGVNTC